MPLQSNAQAHATGAHGNVQHKADLEEGAAKVAGGLAKLERNLLNKVAKPLGALPGDFD